VSYSCLIIEEFGESEMEGEKQNGAEMDPAVDIVTAKTLVRGSSICAGRDQLKEVAS